MRAPCRFAPGAGETVYLPVYLPPGSYVLYFAVPEALSGTPHAAMGMFRTLTVD